VNGHDGGMHIKALVAVTLPTVALAVAPVTGAQTVDGEQCPPSNGQRIVITAGDIDCVTASRYAAQYDITGEKSQVIDPFTCYSGTATTAPLLFQCVAQVEGGTEFAVYPA